MNLLHENIKRLVAEQLLAGLAKLGAEASLEQIYNLLGPTPNVELGHLAFPLFMFAKALRSAPQKLAVDLGATLDRNDLIAAATPAGPYLNIVVNLNAWGKEVVQPILKGDFFRRRLTEGAPRTMIEYSQPNTHKEMHVGHMRNLALGDALIRMHRYAGYDIVSATFPGDVGTHVAKCLWFYLTRDKAKYPEPTDPAKKGEWLGILYVVGTRELDRIKGTPEEEAARNIMTQILKEIEAGAGEYYELWRTTRQWSIDLMKKAYSWANVEFDAWYWESDVDAASMNYARQKYAEGAFAESKGAIGMDLTDIDPNLGFAMMIKSDGTGLYATKDVELARRKFEDNGIERSVYIVDQRQKHHFKQVFAVLGKLGFKQAKDCFHLEYDYVEGKEGMFSSRHGNAVPLFDLITQMERVIYTKHLAGQVNHGDLAHDEAQHIAETVAKGAIKYGMVRIDPGKIITFDMDEWTELHGDCGPYLQYTFARISSLLRKQGFNPSGRMDYSLLTDPREAEILVKAAQFNDLVLSATQQYRPNMLTAYLYDLAKVYNNLNNSVKIKDMETELERNSRMAAHALVARLIEQGLGIMGIPVPERM